MHNVRESIKSNQDAGSIRTGIWLAAGTALCAVGLLVACLCWQLFQQTEPKATWTAATVEALIEAEIPKDASQADVVSWFERHDFPYEFFDGRPDSAQDKVDLTNVSKTIRGKTPAECGFLCAREIEIYFFFDHQGKMAKHWLRVLDHAM